MKVFVVIASFLALAAAAAIDFDYSKPVPIHLLPEWQAQHPEMTKIFLAGGSGASGRVIGGSTANIGQFPHQVVVNLVMLVGSGLCGGTLIHPNWVLTAAHCLDSAMLSRVDVFLGAHDRTNANEAGQQRVTATNRITHENYNPSNFNNDVSLLEIPTANIGANIQPIALARNVLDTFAGLTSTVSGWGQTTDTGATTATLQFVNVPVITNSACAAVYGTSAVIFSTICTEPASCNGDSGGPLIVGDELVGVVSFGAAESCERFPSGFARVTHFYSWISENSGGAV